MFVPELRCLILVELGSCHRLSASWHGTHVFFVLNNLLDSLNAHASEGVLQPTWLLSIARVFVSSGLRVPHCFGGIGSLLFKCAYFLLASLHDHFLVQSILFNLVKVILIEILAGISYGLLLQLLCFSLFFDCQWRLLGAKSAASPG